MLFPEKKFYEINITAYEPQEGCIIWVTVA